ncbi:MAG: tetratricopeptide repeat protein [Pyrinomonadaceae bacterium]|nr:tetratricopeptide repeat protein [Pyrinomonadaceae bacterium]
MTIKNQKSIALIFFLLFIAFASHAGARPLTALQEQTTDEAAEKAELDAALQYVPAERIEKLKAFIAAHPNSSLKLRAQELIVSARAAWGDEKLGASDTAGGLEQFRLAVTDAPDQMTERLFAEVLVRIPSYLFLRGQRTGAMEIARLLEEKVKGDAKRLLMLTNFYTSIEDGQGAVRVSEMAVRLAPEMAAAHQALALARHISLQIEEAATEYARALELDPKLQTARRSLADLRRAQGRNDAALNLYRELLLSNPADRLARAGVILTLLDSGKRDDAEREMAAALSDEPRNLQLLTGAAYWYAAHGENARALELAQKAVEVEPRYVWAQVALARALIADKRPVAAEQALRVARRYGRFPTLDYELANALYAAGLYTEAAAELQRSFSLRNGQIETLLGGRNLAHASNFIELLAPERRASIFQPTAADTEANAAKLRALLAFNLALGEAGKRETLREKEAVMAAREFALGEDAMRAYRQLYVAERLLRAGVTSQAVLDFAEAASSGIEAAIDAPTASVATMSDELYSTRLQAISAGTEPAVQELERNARANILRGRIEEIAGWTLYNQDKATAAVERLRRASGLLPENSGWRRTALWHLGAALEATGNEQEALESYLQSYDRNAPDEGRRAIIERLYSKLNGSLAGLDAKLGQANAQASTTETRPPDAATDKKDAAAEKSASAVKTEDSTGQSASTAQPVASSQPAVTPESAAPSPQPETRPAAPAASPVQSTADNNAATESKTEASQPQAAATPEPTPNASPSCPRRRQNEASGGNCAFSINVDTITIKNNGGTGIVTVQLSGADKITPTTRDWPDITVFAQTLKEYGSFPFLITSISKRTGSYTVTFTTPCGSKDVTVIVK